MIGHWFVKGGGLGALRRNAIARLWWAAHLTYAPWTRDDRFASAKQDDPWYYTRILLANQDIYLGLIERSFGSDRGIMLGALKVIGSDAKRRATSPFAKALTKEINLICSYRELGAMPFENMVSLIEETARRVESRGFSAGASAPQTNLPVP